jgi:hypothetical protein
LMEAKFSFRHLFCCRPDCTRTPLRKCTDIGPVIGRATRTKHLFFRCQ